MSTENSNIVHKTCLVIVKHFRNLLEHGAEHDQLGWNTRIFSHMLHPEGRFVFAGKSQAVNDGTPTHPEHVVPCSILLSECKRLIEQGSIPDDEIAALLARHWKVATITKEEQRHLDYELRLKDVMPAGWRFEDGNTFARFKLAGIVLS